ncbi:MAG: hypothetical protein EBX52_06285 [Proteobacteria bacterium]|nr:hypothetical protein [Pseudomonadota bacterium]
MSLTTGVNTARPFTIRLEQFEGPLDLMLYLIQSQELDISTVSISKITDQYLHALKLMQEMDFDIASEFLLMAATLILWKSKALMPKEEEANQDQEDTDLPLTQEELVRRLMQRQAYLEAAGKLAIRPYLGEGHEPCDHLSGPAHPRTAPEARRDEKRNRLARRETEGVWPKTDPAPDHGARFDDFRQERAW